MSLSYTWIVRVAQQEDEVRVSGRGEGGQPRLDELEKPLPKERALQINNGKQIQEFGRAHIS